jgi:hypothetical protein
MLKRPKKPNKKSSRERSGQQAKRFGQPKSIVQFFRDSPLAGLEMDLERTKDKGRDIKL